VPRFRVFPAVALLPLVVMTACSEGTAPANPSPPVSPAGPAADPSANRGTSARQRELSAAGVYSFTVPADFNGGIFGVEIGNRVAFVATRDRAGHVHGRFHYVQSAEGEDFIFSGRVTCLGVYDTPVLERFPGIPAQTLNRAKWGGVIEQSNDVTQPPGRFLWFQSIDNGHTRHPRAPDLSTLGGFGDEAANEAFCASPNVPNSTFGPHAIAHGNIGVR
jgi:hypothetical protein